MDFSSRNTHRPAARPAAAPAPAPAHKNDDTNNKNPLGKGVKLLGIVLFASALVLSIAAIISISLRSNETAYVDKNNYQVVALVDKQAYFGKITKITDSYLVLRDVYYIQGSSAQNDTENSATTPTLIKRGCEIHRPTNQMIVRLEQVNFWENLQSTGKVAKGIEQLKGTKQDCDSQAQQQGTQQDTTSTDTEKKEDTSTTDDKTTDKDKTTN